MLTQLGVGEGGGVQTFCLIGLALLDFIAIDNFHLVHIETYLSYTSSALSSFES